MENDGTLSSVTRRNNGVEKDFNVRKALLERPDGPVSYFAGSETMSGAVVVPVDIPCTT